MIAAHAREAREEERKTQAKVVLDRYRGPLRHAAWELGDRVGNIRHWKFGDKYSKGNERATQANATTAFRLAQYFGWREALRTDVQLLKFESESDTRLVADVIGHVVWVFATDGLDGTHAMLWAEDQRALGELMLLETGEGRPRSRGYASFVRDFDGSAIRNLEAYTAQLLSEQGSKGERLKFLQWALLVLVIALDEEKVHPFANNGWMQRAQNEIKAAHLGPAKENDVRGDILRQLQLDYDTAFSARAARDSEPPQGSSPLPGNAGSAG